MYFLSNIVKKSLKVQYISEKAQIDFFIHYCRFFKIKILYLLFFSSNMYVKYSNTVRIVNIPLFRKIDIVQYVGHFPRGLTRP